jgi:tRNA A-37 threonylcarbamoyl transferase component Bud32
MTVEVIHCAPNVNAGELRALGFLREQLEPLSTHHTILTNYHLPDGNSTLEIDLVVINSQGAFLLEVKDWWGRIEGDSTHWKQVWANKVHLSPLTSIDSKVKRVHGAISGKRSDLRKVSVVGFVLLVRGDTQLTLDDHPDRKRRVFALQQRLITALTGRDYLFSPTSITLDKARFTAVKNGLIRQKVDPDHTLIGNYEIIGELTPGDTYDAYEAQHTTISNRRVRLKKYHIPAIRSQKHLDETVREFKQDMEALSQVDVHPNIVRAYDFFKDPDTDDTYYLILELVEGQMLREVIDAQALSLAQSARYLLPVADALAFCHQQGIIHRNLTPYSIYVTSANQVKLGDFDFARVPAIGQTITKTGQVLVETKYTAPEQLTNPREADYRADLYSLGVVWYDTLFRRPEEEPVRLALVQKRDLADDARNLLRSLLAPRPEDRPASISEVKDWFEIFAEE